MLFELPNHGLFSPFVALCLISQMNRTRIVVAHVDKRLCVFNSEAENQAIVKNIDWAIVHWIMT